MRWRRLPLAALFWAMLVRPAVADEPLPAMRAFGLLGVWSEDCDDHAGAMILTRFTMTSLGLPRVIVGAPDVILYSSTIDAAVPVAPDEISLTIEGGLATGAQFVTLRLHGGALQIWQSSFGPGRPPLVVDGVDAATHAVLPALHRCVLE